MIGFVTNVAQIMVQFHLPERNIFLTQDKTGSADIVLDAGMKSGRTGSVLCVERITGRCAESGMQIVIITDLHLQGK